MTGVGACHRKMPEHVLLLVAFVTSDGADGCQCINGNRQLAFLWFIQNTLENSQLKQNGI